MRAIRFHQFGPPAEVLHLEDVPDEEPGPGQVRLRLTHRSINPSDLLTISGHYGRLPRLPATPGLEGVGRVEALGEGVAGWRAGDRAIPLGAAGTWRESVIVNSAQLLPVPDAVGDETAAQFVVNPITAWVMLEQELALRPGDWLAQTAAGSTLGRLVIQLAQLRGYRTVNFVRRPEQADELQAAAAAAAMNRVAEIRRTRISGTMGNHERRVGDDWVVTLQGQAFAVRIRADHEGSTVGFEDGSELRVESDWVPGQMLARLSVGKAELAVKVAKIPMGFRMRLRGADLKVHVQSPRQKELSGLMLEKLPPDTSKLLLCPMPGLIVKISVEEGQEVQEGQALATVEAMKMENILKAERRGVVKTIKATPGASLKVDEVIMEFE